MNTSSLENTVWTHKDFEVMSWHDATIWSMHSNIDDFEFLIDLDYIFEWIHPKENETYFKFRVAPVTMVFTFVHSVNLDIESNLGEIEILDLFMENPTPTPDGKATSFTFRFDCQQGEISLKSTGFKMYVRQEPTLMNGQRFGLDERGGINFSRFQNAL